MHGEADLSRDAGEEEPFLDEAPRIPEVPELPEGPLVHLRDACVDALPRWPADVCVLLAEYAQMETVPPNRAERTVIQMLDTVARGQQACRDGRDRCVRFLLACLCSCCCEWICCPSRIRTAVQRRPWIPALTGIGTTIVVVFVHSAVTGCWGGDDACCGGALFVVVAVLRMFVYICATAIGLVVALALFTNRALPHLCALGKRLHRRVVDRLDRVRASMREQQRWHTASTNV